MIRRPNYGQERAERTRRKAAQRAERLAAKAERSKKARIQLAGDGPPSPGDTTAGDAENELDTAADAKR